MSDEINIANEEAAMDELAEQKCYESDKELLYEFMDYLENNDIPDTGYNEIELFLNWKYGEEQ